MSVEFARWVSREDGKPLELAELRDFDRSASASRCSTCATARVVLFAGEWQLNSAKRTFKNLRYDETARARHADLSYRRTRTDSIA